MTAHDHLPRTVPMSVRQSDRYTPGMPGPLRSPVARLLELVEADGRTRNEIAAAARMSPAQLSQVLTGYRADPSITTVGRILMALGKRWGDLDPPRSRGTSGRPALP